MFLFGCELALTNAIDMDQDNRIEPQLMRFCLGKYSLTPQRISPRAALSLSLSWASMPRLPQRN